MDTSEEIYRKYKEDRQKYTELILNSDFKKKIIIAGPGTGKSTLFRFMCEKNIKEGKTKNIVLSFINELVDDLAIELNKLSDVKTLHSFALEKVIGSKIFLKLPEVIGEDLMIIHKRDLNFREIMSNLTISKKDYVFFFNRAKYYAHYCPTSIIYLLVEVYKIKPDKIPEEYHFFVDEFQDFNKLEVLFIDLLSTKNTILIVGDDDQSLYSWKWAFPQEIRTKHSNPEFKAFDLPYCSRCTKVILNAFHNVVKKAKEYGYFTHRKDRKFEYFASEEKDRDSMENSKIIIHKKIFQHSVADYIRREVSENFDPKDNIEILIICSLKKQIIDLKKRLFLKGFKNIQTREKADKKIIIDGFNLLLEDINSNLGWRIVASLFLETSKFDEIILSSFKQNIEKFYDLIDVDVRRIIRYLVSVLRKIKNQKETTKDEREFLYECLSYDSDELSTLKLLSDFKSETLVKNLHKNIRIKITDVPGSKGLTYDYVFLVNFDDKYLIKGKITDENISRFLVALTRAKKRINISTSQNNLPKFIQWIGKENYEERS